MTDTTATCPVHGPACDRIHVGDRVQVVYGEGQLGFGQAGEVVATDRYGNFHVRFDVPVVANDSTYAHPAYAESELAKA